MNGRLRRIFDQAFERALGAKSWRALPFPDRRCAIGNCVSAAASIPARAAATWQARHAQALHQLELIRISCASWIESECRSMDGALRARSR
jgi:hypothetical protein